MKVEIIFTTSSTAKILDVEAVYTKGALLCFQLPDGQIIAHPHGVIFSVSYQHGPHVGTTRKDKTP